MPTSKFFAALIALVALGFIAIEARDAKHSNAGRIGQQCQIENITDIHVSECRIRLTMQTNRTIGEPYWMKDAHRHQQ